MTDERAKEIADMLRLKLDAATVAPTDSPAAELAGMVLHLYDELQAIKSAMSGLAFLGIGGSIKRGGE